jgi:hypothetical protein
MKPRAPIMQRILENKRQRRNERIIACPEMDCSDGLIYEDSMTAYGVPGGSVPVDMCHRCQGLGWVEVVPQKIGTVYVIAAKSVTIDEVMRNS